MAVKPKETKKEKLINKILNTRDRVEIDESEDNYTREELEEMPIEQLAAIASTIGEDL